MPPKKLINPAASSKLAEVKMPVAPEAPQTPAPETPPPQQPKAAPKTTGIISRAAKKSTPTSFRLTAEDKATLQQIADRVNAESRAKISRDKVIQALIHLGESMPAAKILKALGDIL